MLIVVYITKVIKYIKIHKTCQPIKYILAELIDFGSAKYSNPKSNRLLNLGSNN